MKISVDLLEFPRILDLVERRPLLLAVCRGEHTRISAAGIQPVLSGHLGPFVEVVIERNWTKGGVNDSGGYVLQCEKCSNKFAFHLGKDIYDSRVLRGATVVDTYDDGLENKDEVLARHGL